MKRLFLFVLASLSLAVLVAAEPLEMTVHTDQTTSAISTGIDGQFLEHIFSSVQRDLLDDSFAPNLLAVDGPDHPLDFAATRSTDKEIVFLKAVNPTDTEIEAAIRLDGDLTPKAATMLLIAPDALTANDSLDQPDTIKPIPASATIENSVVKFTIPPLSAGVVRVSSTIPNVLTDEEKKLGWRLLWDGKTTEGWRSLKSENFPNKGWVIENGEFIVDGVGRGRPQGLDIISNERFSNFELMVDFKTTTTCNSGIKYLVQTDAPRTVLGSVVGLEFQILDDDTHPDSNAGRDGNRKLGSLYDMIPAPVTKNVNPIGEWNTARIIVNGTHVEHWLNGEKIIEYDSDSQAYRDYVALSKYSIVPGFGEWPDGHIFLQEHGDMVSFRNIKIRVLSDN
ncbi:family 16 glycoside hydrolase [Candidatus Latescibacterota bacterium]